MLLTEIKRLCGEDLPVTAQAEGQIHAKMGQ